MQICKTLSAIALVTGLLGCSGANPDNLRPWEEASKPSAPNVTKPERAKSYGSKLRPGQPYVVVRGDTLYAIAFRLGIDFKELAARNNIGSPFTIKVGQTLSTDMAAVTSVRALNEAPNSPPPGMGGRRICLSVSWASP